MEFINHAPDKTIDKYSFNFKSFLGKGSFSEVYLGKDDTNGQIVAIKIIKLSTLKDPYNHKMFMSEIECMQKLQHPNVIQILNVIHTQNNVYIILEYCNNGDAEARLFKQKRLSEEESLKLISDVVRGYGELLSKNVMHRDLKLANVFINDNCHKIGDFGFATCLNDKNEKITSSLVGTPIYMSPQCMQRQSYSNKNDIWSLGIMFYECIYGRTPWEANSPQQLIQNIYRQPIQFPSQITISLDTQNCIRSMLEINEDKRIGWADLSEKIEDICQKIQKNYVQKLSQEFDSQYEQKKLTEIKPRLKVKISSPLSVKENIHPEQLNQEQTISIKVTYPVLQEQTNKVIPTTNGFNIKNHRTKSVANFNQPSQNLISQDMLNHKLKVIRIISQIQSLQKKSEKNLSERMINFQFLKFFLVKIQIIEITPIRKAYQENQHAFGKQMIEDLEFIYKKNIMSYIDLYQNRDLEQIQHQFDDNFSMDYILNKAFIQQIKICIREFNHLLRNKFQKNSFVSSIDTIPLKFLSTLIQLQKTLQKQLNDLYQQTTISNPTELEVVMRMEQQEFDKDYFNNTIRKNALLID